MIPPLIHQTWKDDCIPAGLSGYAESWTRHNPSWRRILWTDRMLLDFVGRHYPDLLEIYCAYPNPVCRADAARYMLLHKYGGVYADIDVECLTALTTLEGETRAVLCHEPPDHWALHAPYRSHPYILFNGVMAGPAGHPFWRHLLDRLPATRHGSDVLDIAGPCMLTGVYLGFDEKDSVIVHNCQLFTPTNDAQMECDAYGDEIPIPLTKHYWAGSWWQPEKKRKRLARSITKRYHTLRHHLTKGRVLDPEETQQRVDRNVLDRPVPAGDRLAILVPVRDAASHIDAFVDALANTDIPKSMTRLVFCEGDSLDGTAEKLRAVAPTLRQHYRDVVLLRKDVGTRSDHEHRWHRKFQRTRRAGIAAVRNHLIDYGLDEADDWALWIDIGVWRFPADMFTRLKSANARIVAPHCVTFPGGPTFDTNSFVSIWNYPRHLYCRHLHDGLFQPPPRARGRLLLDCVRHSERIELDGVGGTTLLVDASLHRGGLRFPELPYKDLIETEAFGVLAGDLGIKPVGLPNVEVLHVPY